MTMTIIERLFDDLSALTNKYAATGLEAVGRDTVALSELCVFFNSSSVETLLAPVADRVVANTLNKSRANLQGHYGFASPQDPIRFPTVATLLTDFAQEFFSQGSPPEDIGCDSPEQVALRLKGIYQCLFGHFEQGWRGPPGVVSFRHQPSGLNFVRHVHRHDGGFFIITPPRFFACDFPLQAHNRVEHVYMALATQAAAEARGRQVDLQLAELATKLFGEATVQ